MHHNLNVANNNEQLIMQITPISAFSDNYIWALIDNDKAIIVDPGESKPVAKFLKSNKLSLSAILITHWHPDHIGGIDELLIDNHGHIPVYGPESEHIVQITHTLSDGDNLDLFGTSFEVIAVPGHTMDHIAYFSGDHGSLFCGDTLFAGGCGRIFEGTAAMMYESLQKLATLPKNTNIYCAHEYTLSNLQFCIEVEPDNIDLQKRLIECEALRKQKKCTLPSTIKEENMTNCFLRVKNESVITQALNQGATSITPESVFGCLREWKNNF